MGKKTAKKPHENCGNLGRDTGRVKTTSPGRGTPTVVLADEGDELKMCGQNIVLDRERWLDLIRAKSSPRACLSPVAKPVGLSFRKQWRRGQ